LCAPPGEILGVVKTKIGIRGKRISQWANIEVRASRITTRISALPLKAGTVIEKKIEISAQITSVGKKRNQTLTGTGRETIRGSGQRIRGLAAGNSQGNYQHVAGHSGRGGAAAPWNPVGRIGVGGPKRGHFFVELGPTWRGGPTNYLIEGNQRDASRCAQIIKVGPLTKPDVFRSSKCAGWDVFIDADAGAGDWAGRGANVNGQS